MSFQALDAAAQPVQGGGFCGKQGAGVGQEGQHAAAGFELPRQDVAGDRFQIGTVVRSIVGDGGRRPDPGQQLRRQDLFQQRPNAGPGKGRRPGDFARRIGQPPQHAGPPIQPAARGGPVLFLGVTRNFARSFDQSGRVDGDEGGQLYQIASVHALLSLPGVNLPPG